MKLKKYANEPEKIFNDINQVLIWAEWVAEDLIDYVYEYEGTCDIKPSIDIVKDRAACLKKKFIEIDKDLCKEKPRPHTCKVLIKRITNFLLSF